MLAVRGPGPGRGVGGAAARRRDPDLLATTDAARRYVMGSISRSRRCGTCSSDRRAGRLTFMTGPEHAAVLEDLLDQPTHDDPSSLDYPVEHVIAPALSGVEQGGAYGSAPGPVAPSGYDSAAWQRVAGERR